MSFSVKGKTYICPCPQHHTHYSSKTDRVSRAHMTMSICSGIIRTICRWGVCGGGSPHSFLQFKQDLPLSESQTSCQHPLKIKGPSATSRALRKAAHEVCFVCRLTASCQPEQGATGSLVQDTLVSLLYLVQHKTRGVCLINNINLASCQLKEHYFSILERHNNYFFSPPNQLLRIPHLTLRLLKSIN